MGTRYDYSAQLFPFTKQFSIIKVPIIVVIVVGVVAIYPCSSPLILSFSGPHFFLSINLIRILPCVAVTALPVLQTAQVSLT